jgi:hypothetical protein
VPPPLAAVTRALELIRIVQHRICMSWENTDQRPIKSWRALCCEGYVVLPERVVLAHVLLVTVAVAS